MNSKENIKKGDKELILNLPSLLNGRERMGKSPEFGENWRVLLDLFDGTPGDPLIYSSLFVDKKIGPVLFKRTVTPPPPISRSRQDQLFHFKRKADNILH